MPFSSARSVQEEDLLFINEDEASLTIKLDRLIGIIRFKPFRLIFANITDSDNHVGMGEFEDS